MVVLEIQQLILILFLHSKQDAVLEKEKHFITWLLVFNNNLIIQWFYYYWNLTLLPGGNASVTLNYPISHKHNPRCWVGCRNGTTFTTGTSVTNTKSVIGVTNVSTTTTLILYGIWLLTIGS